MVYFGKEMRVQLQEKHNKEALAILENKRSQMILDGQVITGGYILAKFKKLCAFLEPYPFGV